MRPLSIRGSQVTQCQEPGEGGETLTAGFAGAVDRGHPQVGGAGIKKDQEVLWRRPNADLAKVSSLGGEEGTWGRLLALGRGMAGRSYLWWGHCSRSLCCSAMRPSLLRGQSSRVASPTAHTTSRGLSLPSALAQNPQARSLSPPGAAAKVCMVLSCQPPELVSVSIWHMLVICILMYDGILVSQMIHFFPSLLHCIKCNHYAPSCLILKYEN